MDRWGRNTSRIAVVAAIALAAAIGSLAGFMGIGAVAELLLVTGLVVVVTRRDIGVPVRHRTVRVAVIGSSAATGALREELVLAHVRRYVLVGRIEPMLEPSPPPPPGEEALGSLADLRSVIQRHDVDLLLMTDEPSRLEVFDELARNCHDLRVRLCELSGFYEDVFGHIPVAVINSAWFQYIMHPKYRPTPPPLKRALDLVLGLALLIVTLPVLAIAALLIWCEGGPILYRQIRIGEGGRVFTMYKLRTMRRDPDQQPAWSSAADPRVTRIGRALRRSHVDELPQLINVISGEMSLVGPRPEQPQFVAQLERTLPFYSRRHAIKPGLTGWAQVHCGYAGSEAGSLWKLSHDLYYLKHRSMSLDLRILWRTVWIPLTDQYGDTRIVPFVFRRGLEALQAPASAVEAALPAAGGVVEPSGVIRASDTRAVEAPAAAGVTIASAGDAQPPGTGVTLASADGAAARQPPGTTPH